MDKLTILKLRQATEPMRQRIKNGWRPPLPRTGDLPVDFAVRYMDEVHPPENDPPDDEPA